MYLRVRFEKILESVVLQNTGEGQLLEKFI